METTQLELPWEQQEHDEVEEVLIARRKNHSQTPTPATVNGDFRSNNGEDQEQDKEEEEEEEEVKDSSQRNGIKVGEDEKEKVKQQTSEYLVYYDADKGIWKCRICSWDYQGKTCPTGHNQRLCFFHETKGTGSHLESSKVKSNGGDSTIHDNIDITKHNQENGNGNGAHFINKQNGEHQKHSNSEISIEEVDKTEVGEIEVIKEVENEFDVETVLKKQKTHDLFCPNCNSCITKRVILRKRKPTIAGFDKTAKRNKPETSNPSQVNLVSDDDQVVQPLISNEYDQETEPEVFRCLSCFSIFMPTGNGFKLFRMFGNKNNQENTQSSRKEVVVKKSWFSNIFASDKEQSNNQGSSRPEANSATTNVKIDLGKGQVESTASNVNQQPPNSIGNGVDAVSLTSNVNGDENAPSSSQGYETINGDGNAQDRVQSAAPSVNGDGNAQGSDTTIKQLVADESESNGRITTDSQLEENPDHLLTSYHTELDSQSDYPGMFVVRPPLNSTEPEQDLVSPLHYDGLTLHVPPNIGSLIIDNSQMNQVLDVTIQTNNPDLEIGSRAVEQGGDVAANGGRSLDIVKSIVYGGLLEIIASLSVVASAVGAGASTLNVLALGLANIFGGLFVISHGLWDLKNECTRSPDEDRYQQLLGRRADFPLHMLVSLLSYLVFGFLPPLVYGFSFRESNDADLKLLMVAAASIFCIAILGAAKAYVQSPCKSYIATIAYYVTFGFAVSGVSYLFGELIMKLLEKIDVFPSGQGVNMSVLGAGTNPALIATY